MASFGTTAMTHQKLGVAMIEIETLAGELVPMSVMIVPSIAAPIQNFISASVYNMPHIQHLKLAQPVTSEQNFDISLLIGADYYWNFVQDGLVPNGTAVKAWLLTVWTTTRLIVRQHVNCTLTDNFSNTLRRTLATKP